MNNDNQINDGGPAFPTLDGRDGPNGPEYFSHDGMSLRDWFAGNCPLERPHGWDDAEFHEAEPTPPKSPEYSFSANNGIPNFPEGDPRHAEVKQYLFDQKKYEQDRRSWVIRKELYLDVAWRFAYADAMLAARKEPTDE